MTSQRQVYAFGKSLEAIQPTLDRANQLWTDAGITGLMDLPTLDFERALGYMREADTLYRRAQAHFKGFHPGSDVHEAHRLISQAVDEYVEATGIAVPFLEACNEASPRGVDAVAALDGKTLDRACVHYEKGTADIVSGAMALNTATAAVDRP